MSYIDQRIVIVGAARQGTALARYLADHGSQVVLTDRREEAELQDAIRSLGDVAVEWFLGGHPLEILDNADMLCVSGGVPLEIPLVQEAARRGISISNDSQIFMENTPSRVVGITGSAGKTTVTTLVGRIAEKAVELGSSYRKVWVGGNIGNPLIADLDKMGPDDLVVMELSSFQLEVMTFSPDVAVVLNVTPNHLDRHGNMGAYVAAKSRILMFQNDEDIAVINREDTISASLVDLALGHLITFGLQPDKGPTFGSFIVEGKLVLQDGPRIWPIIDRDEIKLRGEHNLLNVLAACSAAYAVDLSFDAMREGIRGFAGVPHRLEFVRQFDGADWYNDSIATSPERVIAAMRSFEGPLVLLAGGRDKDLPWDTFSAEAGERVRELVLFGEAAAMISEQIAGKLDPVRVHVCGSLQAAVSKAAEVALPGDVVLLSPGGTSYDEFTDFAERGERYRTWVQHLK